MRSDEKISVETVFSHFSEYMVNVSLIIDPKNFLVCGGECMMIEAFALVRGYVCL